MARLITKFKYMKPRKPQGKTGRQPGGYAKYIGTREGVERIDDAHERGTITAKPYKHNAAGSKPEYSFHWNGTSGYLFLFEAPIDMLSFISMHSHQNWQQHSYAAACSVSDKVLLECLKNNPQIKNVYRAL